MKADEDIELVRGSGNVFQDLGFPDAQTRQLRAQLAAEIIGVLRRRGISQREAAKLAGLAQADISKIQNAKLGGFTLDRLVTVLARLGRRVEMKVVRERRAI
jgi:predicted XRE-type DNA-binding protein